MDSQFYLDERPVPAVAVHVDGARDEFLARTGFAANEHCGIGGRDPTNLLQDAAKRHA